MLVSASSINDKDSSDGTGTTPTVTRTSLMLASQAVTRLQNPTPPLIELAEISIDQREPSPVAGSTRAAIPAPGAHAPNVPIDNSARGIEYPQSRLFLANKHSNRRAYSSSTTP